MDDVDHASGGAGRPRAEPPARSYREALRRIAPALWLAGLFSALVNVLMLTGPIYMIQVYDRVLASGSVSTLQALFGIVVLLYAFLGLHLFVRARLLSRAAFRLETSLGLAALRRGFVSSPSAAREDVSAALRDLATMRAFVASAAMTALFDLPWIPLFIGVIFLVHPWLGMLTVGGVVVVLALTVLGQMASRRALALSSDAEAAQAGLRATLWRNVDAAAAMGMIGTVERRWQGVQDISLAAMQSAGERAGAFSAAFKSFRLLLQSALLTLGAFLAIRQEISPGMIIAISVVAGRALSPVDQVIGSWASFGRALAAHRALRAAFPDRGGLGASETLDLPAPNGPLVLSGVSCLSGMRAASGAPLRLLDGIDLTLAPGDALAVIGPSAAGKSSLARVMVGAWTPDEGEVRLDGARLDQWDRERLGAHVGYLPQKVEMLPGTIAENIARFDPARTDAEIVAAARLAGVHDMILRLPEGYATRLGDGAHDLSGGQMQRVGLARAVLGVPALVVLDEPNANLDAAGDDALVATITRLREAGSVVVVMAHRPGILQVMSHVMVLRDGRVAHIGSADAIAGKVMSAAQGERAANDGTGVPRTASRRARA